MNPILYLESKKDKNSKLLYNLRNIVEYCIPNYFYRKKLENKLSHFKNYKEFDINSRLSYYNKLEKPYCCNDKFIKIKDFTLGNKYTPHTYYWDTYQYTRYFNSKNKIAFAFGDVTYIPEFPQIVKSRPIAGNNKNSILLNLDKVRHFIFVSDDNTFESKENLLIGRGGIYQKHRIQFYEKYFHHPLCNLGHVGHKHIHPKWCTDSLPISRHLKYKFILCLEGNDVASNLKWVMSSNSIAVMPKPKYETWFMEGKLKENYHYIEIKDDYSDLEEKLEYYIEHTEEALEIINNAHRFVDEFRDQNKEDLIALLVLKKYFKLQEECK